MNIKEIQIRSDEAKREAVANILNDLIQEYFGYLLTTCGNCGDILREYKRDKNIKCSKCNYSISKQDESNSDLFY